MQNKNYISFLEKTLLHISGLKNTPVNMESGLGGFLLFLCYYQRSIKESEHYEDIDNLIESLAIKIFKNARMNQWQSVQNHFFKGTTGIVFLFEHLKKNRLLDTDVDAVFKDIDQNIYQRINSQYMEEHIDELGILGIYLISRIRKWNNPKNKAELIPLEFLIHIADSIERDVLNTMNAKSGTPWISLIAPIVFLQVMEGKKLYPVIVNETLDLIHSYIRKYLNKIHHYAADEQLDILYCVYLLNRKISLQRNEFNKIKCRLDRWLADFSAITSVEPSLNIVQTIFKLNTLVEWLSMDNSAIFNIYKRASCFLNESNRTGEYSIGLCGIAGFGLLEMTLNEQIDGKWAEMVLLN